MVRRDGTASYEVTRTSVLVSLGLVLILSAVLTTVGVAGVELAGLVGGPWHGPGAHHVGESLECGGGGEGLWRDGPYHGLGRAAQRHQGRLHCGRGGRGGRGDQDSLVEGGAQAGRWWGLISLVGRQHGRARHSSSDDRPGRARALNLQLQTDGLSWAVRQGIGSEANEKSLKGFK